MARLLGQELVSCHVDNAAGTPVDMTDLLMEPGDLGNPVTIVDTTTLTSDESTARGGSRGGHSATTTFKTDDAEATAAGYKMLAASLATLSAKTLTFVITSGLSLAYEVIMTNLVIGLTRDEESSMALSWQQTGPITVS